MIGRDCSECQLKPELCDWSVYVGDGRYISLNSCPGRSFKILVDETIYEDLSEEYKEELDG